jgi:serine/threonine-protein kinase
MSTDLPRNQSSQVDTTLKSVETPVVEGATILSVLGSGGMCTVYKARQDSLGRIVAIKVLDRRLIHDPAQVARFLREARLATKLNHPNIATVFSCGSLDGRVPFLLMEYLQGQTLKELIDAQGALGLAQIKQIFAQICAALSHAHENKVIHRDLKPANVMLVADGDGFIVKVLDFGIAKVLEEAHRDAQKLTRTGYVLGSPLYMSPEQCVAAALDARSDIYALGCMLYQAITGTTPFSGNNFLQLASQHTAQIAPTLSASSGKNIDPKLEAIVAKALSKNPQDRFQTVEEFNAELQSIAAGETQTQGSVRKPLRMPRLRCDLKATAKILVPVAAIALAFFFPPAGCIAEATRS